MSSADKGIRRIVIAGLMLAITLLLVFTRFGMIPVPTPAGNATVAHIPAIIAGILAGPLIGLIVAMGFGFASFMNATIPMFKDPLVAVLPRLFIGVTAGWVYMALRSASKRVLYVLLGIMALLLLVFSWQVAGQMLWLGIVIAVVSLAGFAALVWWLRREETPVIVLAIAAAVGSLTNTVLVLTVATLRGYIPSEAAWGIGLTHGLPELIVSAIVTVAVVLALGKVEARRGPRLDRTTKK